MDTIVGTMTDPVILFFALGVLIGAMRSNLEIPAPIGRFLALYLLMAIGFKGGQALAETGLGGTAPRVLGAAVLLATAVPAWSYALLRTLLRNRVQSLDAAAIAAVYGSVSTVTFLFATEFVAGRGDPGGGYMPVALVLMETPALVFGVVMAAWARNRHRERGRLPVGVGARPSGDLAPAAPGPAPERSMRSAVVEAFTDGANLVLIGGLVVGAVAGADGGQQMAPFMDDIFKGMLAFFLLEMGLLVARQFREVRQAGMLHLAGFALVMPLVNGAAALALGAALGLSVGSLTILAALAASASYIDAPAVMRSAVPEASPSRYLTMSLGVTFPFNIIVGVPLFYAVAQRIGA